MGGQGERRGELGRWSRRRKAWGRRPLTFVGAEAVLAVLFEVVGGGAPEEAIGAAGVRAAGVLPAVEQEGELAVLAVGVPVLHADH